MTLVLNATQIQAAQQAFAQAGAAGLWGYLSGQGDSYAKSANAIMSNPSGFFGEIVTQSWISTGADLSMFPDVAETYAGKYLEQIEVNNGTLPNAGQIETAYREALSDNNVPVEAAID